MWVVYQSLDYEGDSGHTYFRNESNAKAYLLSINDKYGDWLIEEVTFMDEHIDSDFRNLCP